MEQTPTPASPEKKMHIKVIISVALFLLLLFLYYGWVTAWSPEAKSVRTYQEKYEKAMDFFKVHEDAVRNDAYGGKTPEETLTMFIDALKKGDIDLASKYFTIDTNENSQYYLTHDHAKVALQVAQEENRIDDLFNIIDEMEPVGLSDSYGAYRKRFSFQKRDNTGMLEAEFTLLLNEETGVWKIENL